MCANFSVLQATESWAGPGNETKVVYEFTFQVTRRTEHWEQNSSAVFLCGKSSLAMSLHVMCSVMSGLNGRFLFCRSGQL